jgi:hypothetical protein
MNDVEGLATCDECGESTDHQHEPELRTDVPVGSQLPRHLGEMFEVEMSDWPVDTKNLVRVFLDELGKRGFVIVPKNDIEQLAAIVAEHQNTLARRQDEHLRSEKSLSMITTNEEVRASILLADLELTLKGERWR